MMHASRLYALIEEVADAVEPSRMLFAEVWFATTGKQPPDIKVHFAMTMEAKAWTEAALITVACALPDWRVVTNSGRGPGEAQMLSPDPGGATGHSEHGKRVRHPGGVSLAILQAMLLAKAA